MWRGFFDHFRECGRRAWLFLLAFAAACPVLALFGALQPFLPLSVIALIPVGLFGLIIGLAYHQNRPPRLGKMPPLERQDLRAARARLLRQRVQR